MIGHNPDPRREGKPDKQTRKQIAFFDEAYRTSGNDGEPSIEVEENLQSFLHGSLRNQMEGYDKQIILRPKWKSGVTKRKREL